ncbi:arf-GAP with dual PH domain-containing protein 1 [Caerostris extrusa]|uniref:Arf-GAP with dual PH domain-containing protein 1 n=1 Tax=Caerostris extrusa TaxID=172846 RepID=A0AAV4Y1G1_CAEEX|nr:arf-GAP with dual PH domain-containing protein 1 [Caerostris extrusa]
MKREEFMHVDKQIYTTGFMEGYLWKRGKEDGRFQQRNRTRNPKQKIEISKLNMTFCPKKVGNPNGAQLTYVRDGSTRNIFIYSSSGSAIVDWYMAIRSIKLNKLLIAYPGTSELELSQFLTRFLKRRIHISQRRGIPWLSCRRLCCKKGVPPGMKEQGFGFMTYKKIEFSYSGSKKDEDRTEWMKSAAECYR